MHDFTKLAKIYHDNLKENKPYLEEKQWNLLAQSLNFSKADFLFYALDFAKNFSQSPISHYQVGAVGLGTSNNLYIGTNIEFLQFPINQSIHAEQSLVSLAYTQGESGLKEIYLTAFPCGHCRQFFREMNNYDKLKIFVSSNKTTSFTLLELLPHSFGPQDLNITQSLFLDKSSSLVTELVNVPSTVSAQLQEKILFSIQNSFAPYSKNPSGVVFVFDDDQSIVGSYLESCAYNPSLSPFQMAYAQIVLRKIDIKKLKEVYFVDMINAQIKQENIITMPQVIFINLKAR